MDLAEQEAKHPGKPRPWWLRVRRWICLYAILPYAAVVIIFVVFQRDLMYQPTVAESLSIADVNLDEQLSVVSLSVSAA